MQAILKRYALMCVALTILCFTCTNSAESYWDDLASNNPSMVFSGAGQNKNATFAFTYRQPLPIGWGGLYAARQTADGKTISEILAAHIQGGFAFSGIGFEAYTTAKRDLWQKIKLGIEFGYFVRPATLTFRNLTTSFGFGNYSATRANDTNIGRDAADTSSTFGWLSFLTATLQTRFGEASATARYKPSFNFNETRIELLAALNKEISDTWSFGISTLTEFDSASIAASKAQTSYLFSFTFTPEQAR